MTHFKESLSPLLYIFFKEKMKIVIDAGAHSFKIGFAGDDLPIAQVRANGSYK